MHFDTALNLAWLFLGIGTLFLMLRASRCVRNKAVSGSWLRVAGALAIACTLFPYISATDDQVWLESTSTLTEHQSSRDSGSSNSNSSLIGLYNASQSSLNSNVIRVACVFVFLAMAVPPVLRSYGFVLLSAAGRSPPQPA